MSRSVVIRATGRSGRLRTIASTTSTNSVGTVSASEASSGARTSVRASGPAGNFRCHPASEPPVRRRRVILLRAKSCAGVSKYVASRIWVGDCSTRATAAIPSNEGITVDSTTSNLRSTSR
ncbi:hypothetical protein PICSAR15_03567 [Mycobacterium avium subsp. paratuberculosis]|nr:hypothetical protein PICSAR118_03706 [Mycobacterium avium subsp. paratuberculosis]CAG7000508.1 hypothetical protein PICSAR164_02762 [Mycobacterium avium subsp. paratuberculosis]CAG7005096.1 hypothetical protein PICSAR14_03514 [Mycobacterium avium subsp. paratuberculosis]CAG7011960.1 hypothetical protein PICSAR15_03567 [Mycobacterium avium subsp. paratuberculosis]CAG7014682.1 hypothetical protein PICSAR145_03821 [Mycobacterium avium subsp. paratuberculosis]